MPTTPQMRHAPHRSAPLVGSHPRFREPRAHSLDATAQAVKALVLYLKCMAQTDFERFTRLMLDEFGGVHERCFFGHPVSFGA